MDITRSLHASRRASHRHGEQVAAPRPSSVPAAAGAVAAGVVAVVAGLAGVWVLAALAVALGLALVGVVVEDARSAWRHAPAAAASGSVRVGRTLAPAQAAPDRVVVPQQQEVGRPLTVRPASHKGGGLRPPAPAPAATGHADEEMFLRIMLLDAMTADAAWSRASMDTLLHREEDRVGARRGLLRRQEDDAPRQDASRHLRAVAGLRSRFAGPDPGPAGVPASATEDDVTVDDAEAALSVVVRYLTPVG